MILTVIVSLLTGFFSALGASGVFVFLMYRQRPKLALSRHIARTTVEGKTFYAIKVINVGRRDAFSVHAELLLIQPHPVEGGTGYNIVEISLVHERLFYIQPVSKVGDKFGAVFEFLVVDDLEGVWNKFQNGYLLFRVTAQDPLSLFSHVFTSEYRSPEQSIVAGRFAKGKSMKIAAQR